MIEITMFYMLNDEFRKYVDKFRFLHKTTLEGALKCMSVKKKYNDLNKKKVDLFSCNAILKS